jgi:anaphase-promoting complex subunit 8
MEIMDDKDPYVVYLRGLLYMRIDQRSAAIECFIQSVTDRPYNWSAWSQLAQLIKSPDMVRRPSAID